jgi:electron transfer flavoprotein beta subunit
MLIFSLLKGVPARTTQVVTTGGILRREQMDIVLNPHDAKAIEAADYVRRRLGGKVVAMTMGPEVKMAPIMRDLFHSEVEGVDEVVILSDRRMAGADTLATSYTLARGIQRAIQLNREAFDKLIASLQLGVDGFLRTARELYLANLIPNRVFSTLVPVKDTLANRLSNNEITAIQAEVLLREQQARLNEFLIVARQEAWVLR